MSDLRANLEREFIDEEYRYGYAQSFLNTKLAMQIKILREQRGKTQAELASVAGTRQAGFSRYENVGHSAWKTDTLWKIARALGVRVNVSFETFGSLIEEKEHFSREYLERPAFDEEPGFRHASQPAEHPRIATRRHAMRRRFRQRAPLHPQGAATDVFGGTRPSAIGIKFF